SRLTQQRALQFAQPLVQGFDALEIGQCEGDTRGVEFEVALQARCTPRRDDAARAVEPSAGGAARLEHAVFGQLDDLLDRQPRCLAELVEFDISLVVEKMQSGGRHAAPPRSPRGSKFDSSRSRSYSAFSSSDSVAGVTICSTQ